MPKIAKIYKISNSITDDIYVGSTITGLDQSLQLHKSHQILEAENLYQLMQKHGSKNFHIELIKSFPYKTKENLLAEKQIWVKQLNASLNTIIPEKPVEEKSTGKRKRLDDEELKSYKKIFAKRDEVVKFRQREYREKNGEILKFRQRIYYEKHGDSIRDYSKKYYERNKERLKSWQKMYRKRVKSFSRNCDETTSSQQTKSYGQRYREQHKEEIKIRNKKYYEENRETVISRVKTYYGKNKEKILIYNRKKVKCKCGETVTRGCFLKHKKSQKCIQFFEKMVK